MVNPESPSPSESEEPTDSGLPVFSGRPGNPFLADVCEGPFAVAESRSVPGMNVDIVRQLTDAIDDRQRRAGQGTGQPLMLLTAPRAGYGKTHLLGRVAEAAGSQVTLLPVALRMGDEIGFPAVGRRALEAVAKSEGARPGWSRLREACAGVWSTLLKRLIEDGTLPCANPDQALMVLEGHPADVFDPDGPARLIGDWLKRHSAPLRKPMAAQAARLTGATADELDAWLQGMLEQAVEGGGAGLGLLRQLLAMPGEEPCLQWLRLMGIWQPVVLLVDHLDGYYRNPEAGLKIASLLLDLADMDEVHVVLSLNQDVWQATFGHHLPSAVEDRLTASQVLLRGLAAEDAAALVRLRLAESEVDAMEAGEFVSFLDVERYFLGRPLGSVAARAFLRHAAQQWELFQHSSASPEATDVLDDEEVPSLVVEGGGGGELVSAGGDADDGEPAVFDDDTGDYVKRVAQGLSEPVAALPQEVVSTPPEDQVVELDTEETGTSEPTPDTFLKLREMLGRLREPSSNGSNGVQGAAGLVAGSATRKASEVPSESPRQEVLLGRFEALVLQMSGEASSLGLDYTKLGDLIRLAGRRFPLVRLSEHELPGLSGRYAMTWNLQGEEILFGLAQFGDTLYWATLAGFAAGRLEEIGTHGDHAPELKLVTFKTEKEDEAWAALDASAVFPEALKKQVDVVSLDSRSVASLYAMQRIIKDAESGAIQAEPAEVMSVLARELDFFWKRVTRPLPKEAVE